MAFGELVIGGFPGTSLPEGYARALRERRRGGAILFKANVEGGTAQVAALNHALHATADGAPPLVGIDQEGGRVARLKAPHLVVPAMRTVASWNDADLAERIARAVGEEVAALGFTIVFAPVLDVNTCPENPVIGDRAFGDDAATCARFGVAWMRGLQAAGVLACGKHFPGHGDTSKDSHVDLPIVRQPRERLEAVELVPFRAVAAAGIASMMTAHVVYTALDDRGPATLSPTVCTGLREAVGFGGLLVSDDLEMQAIAARWTVEDAAVQAVAAGCDALLVCWSGEKQDAAVEAIEREAERSAAFRARCEEARARVQAARRRATARPADEAVLARLAAGEASADVARAIAGRLEAGGAGLRGASSRATVPRSTTGRSSSTATASPTWVLAPGRPRARRSSTWGIASSHPVSSMPTRTPAMRALGTSSTRREWPVRTTAPSRARGAASSRRTGPSPRRPRTTCATLSSPGCGAWRP
jgi:beta-N-acetylhexosaminidase